MCRPSVIGQVDCTKSTGINTRIGNQAEICVGLSFSCPKEVQRTSSSLTRRNVDEESSTVYEEVPEGLRSMTTVTVDFGPGGKIGILNVDKKSSA